MQSLLRLLSLRSSLILFVFVCQSQCGLSEPDFAPRAHTAHLPPTSRLDHEHARKMNGDLERRLARENPVAVRKMSEDPNEMFFLDYWQFATEQKEHKARGIEQQSSISRTSYRERAAQARQETINASTPLRYLSPFSLHTRSLSHLESNSSHVERDASPDQHFQCPTGTGACDSINRPYSCCGFDELCVIIPATHELGDVGCCPRGAQCGGGTVGCDASLGYSSCPGTSNGGCCIPNYVCDGVGCIYRDPEQTTVTSTASVSVTTQTVFETLVTTKPDGGVLTVTNTKSTVTLPILGGGVATATKIITTVITANAPERPTVGTGSNSVDFTSTTTVFPSVCPTGYYQCSAYYPGGCCQVGRDCASTSCPVYSTTTIIEETGVTIAVPTGSGITLVTEGTTTTSAGSVVTAPSSGSCAAGWYLCGNNAGGCCPSGFSCGADTTCTNINANGPGTVNEVAPNGSSAEGFGPWLFSAAIVNLLLCIVL